jgi:hypothetical protein
MLGFFFRHYDRLVERYFIFDDGSEDGSLDILRAHPRVTLRPFVYTHPQSRILSSVDFFENCWHASRGQADWVIVTDIDEHLWHRDLEGYIAACDRAGVTAIPALGFQMLSDTFPPPDVTLADRLRMGAPWSPMSKLNLFKPDAITATGYAPGRHSAEPLGRVVLPPRDEMLLLHYKYLDFERLLERHQACAPRSRAVDRERHFGHKYFWERERLKADWDEVAARLVDVAAPGYDAHSRHTEPRWWTGLSPAAAPQGLWGRILETKRRLLRRTSRRI